MSLDLGINLNINKMMGVQPQYGDQLKIEVQVSWEEKNDNLNSEI